MPRPPLKPDDIPTWSGSSLKHDGFEAFDLGYGREASASMMQAIMGKEGPTLRAESGNCLLIPIYAAQHKLGCLIHLWPDFGITQEATDLIRGSFDDYPELKEKPFVGFVSSDNMRKQYPRQILEVKRLIQSISPTAVFHDIIAADKGGQMATGVKLQTNTGELFVHDDFGKDSYIRYESFSRP